MKMRDLFPLPSPLLLRLLQTQRHDAAVIVFADELLRSWLSGCFGVDLPLFPLSWLWLRFGVDFPSSISVVVVRAAFWDRPSLLLFQLSWLGLCFGVDLPSSISVVVVGAAFWDQPSFYFICRGCGCDACP